MRRNFVLNMYNRATYFDQLQVIMYEKHVTKSFIACAIYHMAKLFYTCVGMCVCNHMPLLKVPGCVSFLCCIILVISGCYKICWYSLCPLVVIIFYSFFLFHLIHEVSFQY